MDTNGNDFPINQLITSPSSLVPVFQLPPPMPLQLSPHPATDRVPSLLGQRTAQPPHRLPNRAARRGAVDGSPGPASPRPEPPPGGPGPLRYWIPIAVLVFSVGVIVLSLVGDQEASMAVGVIVSLTGLSLMAAAIWEGITQSAHERSKGGDR